MFLLFYKGLDSGYILVRFLFIFVHFLYVIYILFENGSDQQRNTCENQIVQSDIPIIKNGLSRVPIVESKIELRQRKEHIFVKEIKRHLTNPNIIPPTMHKQQSPKHPKLRQRIITSLHCSHALLTKEPNPNMSFFDHRHIIGSITNGKGNFAQFISHQSDNIGFLAGKQTTTYHCLTVLCQLGQVCTCLFGF